MTQEIVALRSQVARAGESLAHQKKELDMNRDLLRDGFVSATRVAQLEAAVADYGVKLGERHSELARAEQRRVEIELKLRTLDGEYRQQASEQLKVVASRLSEIQQELRKAGDAAGRQVIVAPAAGEVIGLKVTAPGAVISARETIAEIVPADPALVIEAHLRTEDIDQVRRGQQADIRFTAFMTRSTQLVSGTVRYVSADRLVDRDGTAAYYTALIEVDARSLDAAGGLRLVAGMPAEVYLKGGERSPLRYLIEPISQVLRRAARGGMRTALLRSPLTTGRHGTASAPCRSGLRASGETGGLRRSPLALRLPMQFDDPRSVDFRSSAFCSPNGSSTRCSCSRACAISRSTSRRPSGVMRTSVSGGRCRGRAARRGPWRSCGRAAA